MVVIFAAAHTVAEQNNTPTMTNWLTDLNNKDDSSKTLIEVEINQSEVENGKGKMP
jgi:hypothetical protein